MRLRTLFLDGKKGDLSIFAIASIFLNFLITGFVFYYHMSNESTTYGIKEFEE